MKFHADAAVGWNRDNNGVRFGIGHTTGGLYFFRTTSDPGTITNAATYDVVLTDTGNVGIGSLAPSTLLQVGNATCNGST